MKTSMIRKVLTLGVIAALPVTTFAHDEQALFRGARPSIEGVWDSTVTLQAGGPSGRSFSTCGSERAASSRA